MTLTFQKEVVERMVAPPGNEQRSRLSIMTQYLCDVRDEFIIPGKAFVPQPDVDAGVVHFVPRIEPLIDVPFEYVEKTVRHVFHYRQKMIKHGVQTLFPPDQPELTKHMFKKAGVDPTARSYMLTIDEIGRLSKVYQELCLEITNLFKYYYRDQQNVQAWRQKLPLNL